MAATTPVYKVGDKAKVVNGLSYHNQVGVVLDVTVGGILLKLADNSLYFPFSDVEPVAATQRVVIVRTDCPRTSIDWPEGNYKPYVGMILLSKTKSKIIKVYEVKDIHFDPDWTPVLHLTERSNSPVEVTL
jgi:hypothetical protein